MRLELKFFDYEKNEAGVHVTIHDIRLIRRRKGKNLIQFTDHGGSTTTYNLEKLADLQLIVYKE